MPLRIGDTFAGYRILRLLGSGGMGEVYLAQHPRLPRHDALKVLRPDVSNDSSFRDRFIREADLASGLRHPHIVGIHDRGEHDGQLWIAMDYIDGTDAAELMRQRYPAGMPVEVAISIITAVASALDYAHKRGLLHRDVKPANIIVADLDSDDRSVFLADFGIARPLDDISGITTTNMTVGTVAYAAPEQLMGDPMNGRTDQYALAATAYHLLTGVQLFPHSNPAVVISRHLNTTPPTLGERRADYAGLDEVLQIALAKSASDRFPSCSAFAQALADESLPGAASANATTQEAPHSRKSGPTSTPGPSGEPPATRFRRAWVVLGSVAAIMLLICVVVLVWRFWGDSRQTAGDGATSTTSASPPPQSTAGSRPPQSTAGSPPPPALTAASPTVPMRTPEPGLVNDAADPCSWCDTPNVKFFQSPTGNISCEIDYRRGYGISDSAYCMSISPPQNVSMNSGGVLTVCTAGDSCLSNPPQGEPTLPYGHTTGIGPFTCLSESSGVTCTVGSGRGFAISKSGITPVG
jgi:serine/threonine-protein kinase